MSELPFTGYPAQVWATCWQAMSWLNNILASTSKISAIDTPTDTVFSTLLNGVHAIDAYQAGAALSVEYQNLLAVEALRLLLGSTEQQYLINRVAGILAASVEISALPTSANPFTAVERLTQGQPAITNPGFIEWAMTFTGEPVLFADILPDGATNCANAWLTIANTIATLQGNSPTAAFDTAARIYRCSAAIATGLSQLQSGPFSSAINTSLQGPQLTDEEGNLLYDEDGNPLYTYSLTVNPLYWNNAVALPTMLLDVAAHASNPASLAVQQSAVIRYALIYQMQSLALLQLALREHNIIAPVTANLNNTESLADLAARTTGNFENWPSLAVLNQIKPPYPGPTNQALALSGKSLFITSQGVSPDPDASGVSYANNVLGTDWSWGPINGTQPVWLGDIPLITGYLNFARSIGRRLQTPLGSLIFHRSYGSRIPPEVGAIQSIDEAARLNQYGRSAILADPRTGNILSSLATTQPGFLATFSANIQPIGPGSTSVQINETIGAVP